VNKGKWQVSSGGGNSPLWSPDVGSCFIAAGMRPWQLKWKHNRRSNEEILKPFSRGNIYPIPPKVVFTKWDIPPNGKKFLMIKPAASTVQPQRRKSTAKINIVLNWFEELKQRVPVK